MSDILVFRHIDCEGPGYFGEYLERKGLGYPIVDTATGTPLPSSIDGVGGLVFMGGPMSVNDDLPWIGPS